MQPADFTLYLPYIFSAAGLIVIVYALLYSSAKSKLKQTGIQVDGIVFKQGLSNNYNSSFDSSTSSVNDKITIRFVTKDMKWITGKIEQNFQFFYTGQYKDGEQIKVYYDPQNPSNFYVDTKQSESTGRIFAGVIGLLFLVYGLYKIFV